MTLRTVEPRNLESITIYVDENLPGTIEEEARQEWKDLDRLLVQFWNSHLIRPRFVHTAGKEGRDLRVNVPNLLPESTRRGIVDLFEVPQ